MAGTRAQCNRCGTVLTVPYPNSGPTPVERPHTLPAQPAAKPARASGTGARSKIPPVVWIVCAIGGGTAVLMLLAMLINSFLSSGRRDTASPRSTEDSPILSDGSNAPDAQNRQGFPIPYQEHRTVVTGGPSGCPVVIVDQDVWNLEQNRVVQRLEGTYGKYTMRALSANGEWFAVGVKASSRTDPSITIWHTPTGKIQWEIPGRPVKSSQILTLTRDKYLLIEGSVAGQVEVWDVETGEMMAPLQTPQKHLRRDSIAFAPGGESFVTKDARGQHLLLYNTQTGEQVAKMDPPLEMDVRREPSADIDNAPRPMRKPAPNDALFVYSRLEALAFSPDGQALAALSAHPRMRLISWNRDGSLLFDEAASGVTDVLGTAEHSVQWLLDGKGWLLSGHIFDRESKRVILKVRLEFGDDLIVHIVDERRLLGVFGHPPTEIALVEVPWDRLRRSLKLIEERAPAIVTPGQAVSIRVELDSLIGGAEDTRSQLTEALTARLARDGVRVESGQDAVFRLRFTEQMGNAPPIFERQSLSNPRSVDTRRSAIGTKGAVFAELITPGCETPLWRDTLMTPTVRGCRSEDLNDPSVRKRMISSLIGDIHRLDLPYFVPLSDEHLALPAIVE